MPHIYSTLTAGQLYTIYDEKKSTSDAHSSLPYPPILKQIRVEGGTNVLNQSFITPKGVRTHVTDDELEWLKKCPVFLQHEKNGFITVTHDEEKVEKVVKNMKKRDKSAPHTESDPPSKDPTVKLKRK